MHGQRHSAKYGDGSRKGFARPRAVCADKMLVVAYGAAGGHAGDSPMLARMCAQLPAGSGDFCADVAYLSRANCEAIEEIGRRPVIMVKSNSRQNGHGARGRMIRWARESPDGFAAAYHKRSRTEAVFSSMKRLFGASLRSRRPEAQMTEVALIVACYNMHVLANL